MKTLLRGTALTLALASCFGFGFYYRNLAARQLPGARPLNTLLGVKTTSPALSAEGAFRENYARILNGFAGKTDAKELKYAGMAGLVGALGDPHTNFFPPEEAKAFREETQANFFGVGARLSEDPLGARVPSVFEDGPAYAAGLRAGDTIISVDGQSVGGKTIESIVTKIKGPEGTKVRLTILRPKVEKPIELTIRRARVIVPTVEGKLLEGSNVGYVSVSMFSEPTATQFDAQVDKLEGLGAAKGGLKGLVIDMRGNPGGLLTTAQEMVSRWVDDDIVVRIRGRAEEGGRVVEEQVRTASGMVHRWSYPVVVLINEESASAAEIFSGDLRDYGKAKLIGAHSYGKASVQNLFPLRDGSSAKITIAKYLLPKTGDIGRKLNEDGAYVSGGLKPDVAVEPDYDAGFAIGDVEKDNQLRAAVAEVLKR